MKNNEWYCSVDIETNGPIAPNNSMLSLGAAAFSVDGKLIDTFSINFQELEGSHADSATMKWWQENKEAYEATRINMVKPAKAIEQFVNWVNKHEGKPTFIGYPATFDFSFVYYYIVNFGLKSPFSFSALDIKTYVSAMLKLPYRESTKKNMPKRWFSDAKHTHIALDDAIEQGQLFCAMLKENIGND